jgi:hypothetical protein
MLASRENIISLIRQRLFSVGITEQGKCQVLVILASSGIFNRSPGAKKVRSSKYSELFSSSSRSLFYGFLRTFSPIKRVEN